MTCLLFLGAMVAAAAGLALSRSYGRPAFAGPALTCGVERWQVKTLQDQPRLLTARRSTITTIGTLPYRRETTRSPLERRVYTVPAQVTEVIAETDSDLHVVLQDPKAPAVSMIAEMPSLFCAAGATSARRAQMSAARAELERRLGMTFRAGQHTTVVPPLEVTVTGVLFLDRPHGQTGRAANNAELHPVLKITSSRR